ncbi:MAG: GDP-mannose-dependent alpha-(1-2)-phosphatidylinositol mannosyltransferase [Frankiales bacterium]|nr:GDP-mannose-dependent alpha-(1-2)-phosphatidylinositol mannosyltransferase [Frankiales bacterium]
MKVGLVCPYAWYVPGGVQAHIKDFAEALLQLGHEVSVIAPADDDDELPSYVVPAGRAVPLPYNGSVARLNFGPLSNARVRRWLREGAFDVLHVHEPATPSLSLLALYSASGPIVGTFHSSVIRSRLLQVLQTPLQPALEKIGARIAVSEAARRTVLDHGGGDVVVVPNGVHVSDFEGDEPLEGYGRDGLTIGFLGRYDEPRKGFPVLREAFVALAERRPGVRLLVAGRGDAGDALDEFPEELRGSVTFMGMLADKDKARFLHSLDVYVAPNTGGESFGIILLEAAAASTPIVASDLDAFRAVLDDGAACELVPVGDVPALTDALDRLLGDEQRRAELVEAGHVVARRFDWSVIAQQVLAVYETVTHGGTVVVTDEKRSRA